MARTIDEIYTEAKQQQLLNYRLSEVENSSKMSVINALLWTTSACIWTFENLLDVFQVDLANALGDKVNGTPKYYIEALRKFQYGDSLEMNESGTQFHYPIVDESKRIITKASYSEAEEFGFHDKTLILKVAKDSKQGQPEVLSTSELLAVRKYIREIAFAGTSIKVVSRKGDVLIPRVTVCYDGMITEKELLTSIRTALNNFIESISFDAPIYSQAILDSIYHVPHVKDVFASDSEDDSQGIFIAKYGDDNKIVTDSGNNDSLKCEFKAGRIIELNSGYLKESSKSGEERDIDNWEDCITLRIS